MTMAFVFNQKVLFKHCDPARIVFYPRYFEMINDCVEAWFDVRLDHPFETMHASGWAVPTARIDTSFKAPSRHGDQLEIILTCERIGGSSVDIAVRATCDGQERFFAHSTLVHVDDGGRPTRWPDALRTRLTDEISGET